MYSTQNKSPLISVGILTYNRPATLHQLLSSVINQTYKNLEIIVSDDCSSNKDTQNIVKEFIEKDNRIKYFYQDKNIGLTQNTNFVFGKATGEYFVQLNDDDWIDSDYIEKCLYELQNHSDYVLVCGKTKFYLDDKFVYNGDDIDVNNDNSWDRIVSFYMKQLGGGNCPNFGIISRKNLSKVSMQNALGFDNIFFANLAFMGKIKTLKSTYIHRRLGGESKSLKNMALKLKLSTFQVKYPFITLWFNIFKDIGWESKVFNSTNLIFRFLQAIKLSVIMFVSLNKYFSRYKMRSENLIKSTSQNESAKPVKTLNAAVATAKNLKKDFPTEPAGKL